MIEYVKDMWTLALEGEKQGVLFFIVVYAFVICLYSFLFQYFIRQWPTTKGLLQGASVEAWGSEAFVLSDQDYKATSLYEYQVSDKSYQGTRISPWVIVASHNAKFLLKTQLKGIHKNLDGTINVIYNPRNPAKSYLLKPSLLGMGITLGIAVIPLILYVNAYV